MTLPPDRLKTVYAYRFNNGTGAPMNSQLTGFGPMGRFVEQHHEWNVTAEPSIMDRIIDWKINSPLTKLKVSGITEEVHLIRQFTVELRVNYADSDKNDVMRKSVAAAARHMFATANLLADGQKPDIAIYSDDYFAGRSEIELLEDVIQQGLEETAETVTEGEVSSELMAAVRDSTS